MTFCGNIAYPLHAARWLATAPSKLHALELLKYIKIISPAQAQAWLAELGDLDTDALVATVLARIPEDRRNGLSAQKIARWIAIVAGMTRMAREYEAHSGGRVDALDVFFMRPSEYFPIGVERWRDEWMSEWNDVVARPEGEARVVPSLETSPAAAAETALRFHYLDCDPGEVEQAEFLPTFGAAVSEALRKREAERGVDEV